MKHHFRLGIRGKFVILIASILSIVFTGIALYLARLNTVALRTGLYDEAKSFATLATTPIGNTYVIYKDSGTINIDREISNFAALNKTITNIAIIDLSGEIVYTQHSNAGVTATATEGESFDPIFTYDNSKVLEKIIFPYRETNGIRRYSVVYSISSSRIAVAVRNATISVIVLSIIGLVTTSLLLYFFVNYWLLEKVRKISKQSLQISNGQIEQNIEINSTDELGDLAHSVNTMANSLKSDIEKLRALDVAKSEFMMITSHNLRTPLTIMNGFIENSESYTTVDQLKHALEEIAAGSKRLSIFAEDVLTISRFELGEQIKAEVITDLHKFLQTIGTDFSKLATLKNVTFEQDIATTSNPVSVNQPYLRAAVWNLLDNALKFTDKRGMIKLSMIDKDNHVEISIQDNGIGISPDEVDKLFTRFHRGTSTLTYNYEGTGIGLYATKMIIDKFGGTIKVQSILGTGSRFTIVLPYA